MPARGIFMMSDYKAIVLPVIALITFQGLQCLLYLYVTEFLKTKTFLPAFYASQLKFFC